MWKWLKNSKDIKNDLLSFRDEPLSGLSALLLIILNVFIFTNIMIGVDVEMDKAPKVSYYYPNDCNKHFNKIQIKYKGFNSDIYSRHNYTYTINGKSKYCRELNKKIEVFTSKSSFKINSELIKTIQNQQKINKKSLNQILGNYNTRLFETIASMPNNSKFKNAKNVYDAIVRDNEKLENKLKSIPSITTLNGYSDYVEYIKINKNIFFETKKLYKFWQPFKAYMHMLIFIVPLFFFFSFFYYRTKKKQLKGQIYNPIIKIISANVSFLLLLPFIWHTIILIYDFLPKTFLKNIIEFLVDIGLISLLNYFAIFLIAIFFGGLIYYIQKRTLRLKKKIPSNKKYQKLISWSQCFNCELKINYTNKHCPFCGIKLHQNCKSCNNQMVIHEKYCPSCGNEKANKISK
ncbi:hypothetical protein MNB_ARC-1_1029 [hydrothermal vent metagenome]|uniref:DZANK-type domain-containing protein n=1 Tax=hydrothermal vent metagenome TaxID=652676 RepID=A0A3B1E0V1_9ZZZZ